MKIEGATALVTGANRGLGKALVEALVAGGALKVYAAAREATSITTDGVRAIALDITDAAQVTAAAGGCRDVDLLINNAGVAAFAPLLQADSVAAARQEMETNYFGTLAMCRAFAPILAANGGGALVNMLSVVSWLSVPMQGSYCASKAAQWSMTNGIRIELKAQGTLVAGAFAGYIETDMTSHLFVPKARTADIAAAILAGIEAEQTDILADERSRQVLAALSADPRAMDGSMLAAWEQRAR